jgi:hypothetical protein
MNQRVINDTYTTGGANKYTGNWKSFFVLYCATPLKIRINNKGDFVTYKTGEGETLDKLELLEVLGGNAINYTIFVTDQKFFPVDRVEAGQSFLTVDTGSITDNNQHAGGVNLLGVTTINGFLCRRKNFKYTVSGAAAVSFKGSGSSGQFVFTASRVSVASGASSDTIETDDTINLISAGPGGSNITLQQLWYPIVPPPA